MPIAIKATAKKAGAARKGGAAISMRVPKSRLERIDAASEIAGVSRTQFMVNAAYQQATDTLLDQAVFQATEAEWDRLVGLLDEPPKVVPRLVEAFAKGKVWDDADDSVDTPSA